VITMTEPVLVEPGLIQPVPVRPHAEDVVDSAPAARWAVEEHAWSEHAPGLRLTISAGVSAGRAGDFPAVLARADAALYAAKGAGRNRVVSS